MEQFRSEESPFMLMKVLYKLPTQRKPVQSDWIVEDLKEMMYHLKKEGVTKETVEYLYIHYSPRGSTDVMELVAIDNSAGGVKRPAVGDNVIPFPAKKETQVMPPDKKAKPKIRIKAKHNSSADAPLLRSFLYTAEQV